MAKPTEKQKKSVGTMDFTPIAYNVTEIEPDAPEGEYKAVTTVKLTATSKDKFPMFIVEWKIKEAADEDNATAVGGTVTDFIALFPAGDRRGNMGKKKLQQLFEMFDIDPELMPKKIQSKKDLEHILKALSKKTGTIYVTHKEADGEVRANVSYTEPAGLSSSKDDDEEEEEEEDETEEEETEEEEEEEEEEESDDEEEEEEDEEEEEEAPPAKKAPAKKTAAKKK